MTKANEKSSLKWWDALILIVVYFLIQIALSILAILYALVKAPENSFSQLVNGSSLQFNQFVKLLESISNGSLGQSFVISAVLSFIFLFVYLRLRKINHKSLGLNGFKIKELGFAIILTIGLLVIGFAYEFLIKGLGLNTAYQAQQIVMMFGRSTSGLILIFLSMVIMAPILEEIIFRGILFNYLDTKMKFIYAALISAFIFASVHGLIFLLPEFMLIGFVLAYAVKRSGSIWPAILIHVLNNGTMFALLYLGVVQGNF